MCCFPPLVSCFLDFLGSPDPKKQGGPRSPFDTEEEKKKIRPSLSLSLAFSLPVGVVAGRWVPPPPPLPPSPVVVYPPPVTSSPAPGRAPVDPWSEPYVGDLQAALGRAGHAKISQRVVCRHAQSFCIERRWGGYKLKFVGFSYFSCLGPRLKQWIQNEFLIQMNLKGCKLDLGEERPGFLGDHSNRLPLACLPCSGTCTRSRQVSDSGSGKNKGTRPGVLVACRRLQAERLAHTLRPVWRATIDSGWPQQKKKKKARQEETRKHGVR